VTDRPPLRSLGSAPLPEIDENDHVRGAGPLIIVYADFECAYCALLHERLRDLTVRQVFRHFPVGSSHPRAWAAAGAAEAAGAQQRFWEMHDLLMADQARLEDPHLWERARVLRLNIERFESDRRSEAVRARIRRDFEGGIRAGVAGTPTLFAAGQRHTGRITTETLERLTRLG